MRSLFTIVLCGCLMAGVACDNSSTRDDSTPGENQAAEDTSEEAEESAGEDAAGEDAAGEGGGEVDEAALRDPSLATAEAPEEYRVRFETTKGGFTVEVNRAWAPNGADRFYNLVKMGFFDDVGFFRVVEGFMVQFGIHGDPEISSLWMNTTIPDDEVTQSNERGTLTFATRGPNTRTTQIFINFTDNAFLDGQGFSPFGRVVEGMDVVDNLYAGYGEGAPRGRGPDQGRIQNEGNEYLRSEFENLDFTTRAFVVED